MRFVPVLATVLLASRLLAGSSSATTAIDSSGNVWRTGQTTFILTTATAFQKSGVGTVCATETLSPFQPPDAVYCKHAFLIKQDATGKLLYATYLGGSSQDGGTAITTDAQGSVYVTGYTYSADFPVTPGVAQSKNAGPLKPGVFVQGGFPFAPVYVVPGGDVFVTKFASDGTLVFSTFLGGSGSDIPSLIEVDSSGSVFVSGVTASNDFPVAGGAISGQPGSSFFARLSATGKALSYSTYSAPSILAFDVDNQGHAYLTGSSSQPGFAQTAPYVTVVDTSAGAVVSSTPLSTLAPKAGGSGVGIAMSAAHNLFLAVSPTPNQYNFAQPTAPFRPLGASSFLELSADASRVVAETDVGGTQFDSVMVDGDGNGYAFGHGTGAIPATAPQVLARPCSPDGGSFVLESNAAGKIVAATYFRQGDDSAVRITSSGTMVLYRSQSSATLTVDLTLQPAGNFGCPENLASNVVGPGITPGEIFVLSGNGLGPTQGIGAAPDAAGQYPTSLGGVQVLFNSKPVPLLFVQAKEIHAVAPFALENLPVVQVLNEGQSTPPLDVSRSSVNPGIFAVNGQGAIVNQDGTVNTPANPAPLGSVVSVYCTGTGYLEMPVTDGHLTPIPPPFIATELAYPQLTFAGVAGITLWSGSAPGLIFGVTQINVRVPAALPAGTALGAVPVVLDAAAELSPPVLISVKAQ